jgi:hypothetical protein
MNSVTAGRKRHFDAAPCRMFARMVLGCGCGPHLRAGAAVGLADGVPHGDLHEYDSARAATRRARVRAESDALQASSHRSNADVNAVVK